VGFVFQFYNLLGEMTALENAMLPAMLQRAPTGEAKERAVAALAEVGLADRLGHRPGELSGGEQQRVALARALVGHPRLLIAAEPTGTLDPKTSEVIWELFMRLGAERGLATVIATHNHDLARKADRGYRIADGRAVSWPSVLDRPSRLVHPFSQLGIAARRGPSKFAMRQEIAMLARAAEVYSDRV